uniref:Uncharacterized protein n=1 Tax=Panagrolaimus davidi TaxID=227884 RepID=A0A914P107_9BILA
MKPLYHKIKAVEHNVEEWFYLLLETRDIDFVADNVEYRLGKSLFKIKLWKLYLTFLDEHGEYTRLLETLSLYCRFFMDDEEMKEKYKTEMAKFGFSGFSLEKVFAFESKPSKEISHKNATKADAQPAKKVSIEPTLKDSTTEVSVVQKSVVQQKQQQPGNSPRVFDPKKIILLNINNSTINYNNLQQQGYPVQGYYPQQPGYVIPQTPQQYAQQRRSRSLPPSIKLTNCTPDELRAEGVSEFTINRLKELHQFETD